ncbi:penicillin-binding protein 2 [candidate division WOR-3 bacterium]|nr:penicillin-binding protein 2 [candidate division WOR-3 bacterium]
MIKKWNKHPKIQLLTIIAFASLCIFFFESGKIARSETFRNQARLLTAYSFSPEILRGSLIDRKGRCIAYSHTSLSVFMYPESVTNINDCAQRLERIGISNSEEIIQNVEGRKGFTWIERDVSGDVSRRVREENISGVGVFYDQIRRYARSVSFGNLTGCVDPSNRGLSGLEYTFDNFLKGENDTAIMSLTHRGNLYLGEELDQNTRFRGDDVFLCIDMDIQDAAYNSLKKAVETYSAKSGTVIVLDPKTGAVRTMVTVGENDLNMTVDWQYEPGSTFKLITAAAALSENSVSLDEIVEYGKCEVQIGDYLIKDAEIHDTLNFREAFVHSSNVGMVDVARKTGTMTFNKYILLFGFGEKTEIDLPHEARGYVPKPNEWIDVKLATVSFGQGLSVTPLQLTAAYAAVANGGFLLRPKIVDSIVSPSRVVLIKKTDTLRRVLTVDVCDTLTALLVDAVERGTGKYAKIEDVSIAGKTGTAQIASESGGYREDAYISSFIGYFPAEDPQYVICVIIEEPRGAYYGGYVAAPVFREITEYIIRTMKLIETARSQI